MLGKYLFPFTRLQHESCNLKLFCRENIPTQTNTQTQTLLNTLHICITYLLTYVVVGHYNAISLNRSYKYSSLCLAFQWKLATLSSRFCHQYLLPICFNPVFLQISSHSPTYFLSYVSVANSIVLNSLTYLRSKWAIRGSAHLNLSWYLTTYVLKPFVVSFVALNGISFVYKVCFDTLQNHTSSW